MKTYTQDQLKEIIAKHQLWLNDEEGGERANLSSADLSFADLSSADLSSADLRFADLRFADLSFADLRFADLRTANLRSANLRSADLRSADLSSADLSSADLRFADLRFADLSFADLRTANLSSANLRSADLRYASDILCVGNMINIKSVQADLWPVTYTCDEMQIGCQRHTLAEWWAFGDDEISRMDSRALGWWKVWKPILQAMIAASPAEPTGYVEKEGDAE